MSIPINRLLRSRRRTIALIIEQDGSLTVRAPIIMPEASIIEFVLKHAAWIHKKQLVLRTNPSPNAHHFLPGEKFLFLGCEYPLMLEKHQQKSLRFSDGSFHLSRTTLQAARNAFIRWYRQQARKVLTNQVNIIAKEHGFQFQKVRISSARTRWGSCSTSGNLSFPWRLVMAPPEVIDYVVVHELVHTRVHNHSAKFWKKVGMIMPDYKQHLTWLKKNGATLTLGEI
jgi:predicted metal-dependent hydrolase